VSETKIPTGFQVGEVVYFSTGGYSDYSVDGVFSVEKNFELDDVVSTYREKYCTKHEYPSYFDKTQTVVTWKITNHYSDDHVSFIAWLTKEGYISPVDSKEIHIGDYGQCDPYIAGW